MSTSRVPFLQLTPGEDASVVQAALGRVIERGWFVRGPEVEAFEFEFAAACRARHAVGVGTGTDALALILRGLGIGPGDEVVTSPLSAAYTALAIMMVGARPVFADLDPDRLTLDPAAAAAAISSRTAALLPVHLYGQAADLDTFATLAERHGLAMVEDCCQAHLATSAGRPVGTVGIAGAFSFYPTKNLGALGDAGAVVTHDSGLAQRIRRLRNGGQVDRYLHVDPGVNSRLDEIQAAVLRARLPRLSDWTARRRDLAARYREALQDSPLTPLREVDAGHVYHLFVARSPMRDAMQAHLGGCGVETLVHYPVPLPRQPAFASTQPDACPIAERACEEIVSLPLHTRLSEQAIRTVAEAVRSFASS